MAQYQSTAINWEMFGINILQREDLPNATSYLFGAWTRKKITDPNAFIGNNNILEIGGDEFYMRNITDSVSDQGHRPLNHNFQLFAKRELPAPSYPWFGDICSYYSPPDADITLAEKFGWKFTAWQFINDVANERMIFRQWIKIPGKALFKTEASGEFTQQNLDCIMTYAQARQQIVDFSYGDWTTEQAAAWVPGVLKYIRLGSTGGGGDDTYLTNVNISLDVTAEPSLQDLETMALNFSPDLTAWGDWKLDYPSLDDDSGNNRTFSVVGATHEGILFAEPGIMASTVGLTGPSTGTTGQASTNFTIAIDGETFETATFTPSDGGAGGTFNPSSVVIPAGVDASGTFTYTPATDGVKTVSITNDIGLVVMTSVSYTAEAPQNLATAYTLTGPEGGTEGQVSDPFTITIAGDTIGQTTFTPSDSGGGGSFTPSTVVADAGTNAQGTFTYTPGSAGSKTISVTNDGGLSDPASVSYLATEDPTATAYTLTGPSSGTTGQASTAFTIAIVGDTASPVTFTPSDGGNGGAFTPATVQIAAGTDGTGTFTYTPATDGVKAISTTNDGGLSGPASVSYTAASAPPEPVAGGEYSFAFVGRS